MMALREPSKYVDRRPVMLPCERSIRRILIAFVRQDECHPPLEMLRLVPTDRADDRVLYHLYPGGYWIFRLQRAHPAMDGPDGSEHATLQIVDIVGGPPAGSDEITRA